MVTAAVSGLAWGTLLFACAAARAGPPPPAGEKRTALSGRWGGDHAGLEVTETGARLAFDCASGSIEGPITPDEDGRFEVTGRYVREGPGPTRPEQAQGVGARYLGQLDGNTLTLSVRLTLSHDVLGPFTLTKGRMARIRQCD